MKIYLILFIVLFNKTNADNKLYSRFIGLIGPTRAGKSCFINTITGNNFAKVGDEEGESTTKASTIYEAKIDGFTEKEKFFILDSMGLGDFDRDAKGDFFSITDTLLTTINHLEKSEKGRKTLNAFLLFESLGNDSNNLNNSIKKLIAVFGDNIVKSIIVIFNKVHNAHLKRKNRC